MPSGSSFLRLIAEEALNNPDVAKVYLKLVREMEKSICMPMSSIINFMKSSNLKYEVEELAIDLVKLDLLIEASIDKLIQAMGYVSIGGPTLYTTPNFTRYAIKSRCKTLESPSDIAKLLGFTKYFKEIKAKNVEKRSILALKLALESKTGYLSVTEIRDLALRHGFKAEDLPELIPEMKGLDLLIPIVEATGALKIFLKGEPPYYKVPKFLTLGLKSLLSKFEKAFIGLRC